MSFTTLETLHYNDLPQGGFAGLKERRLVTDERAFGHRKDPRTFNGLGNFIYLADAQFNPKGETRMHPHHEIDVISVMAEGRIEHAGSLEHGANLEAGQAQVQRAGGEGFSHNEINPDITRNQLIQIWVLPDNAGEPAGYKLYSPKNGQLNKIYGGAKTSNPDSAEHFNSQTAIAVAPLASTDTIEQTGELMAYLSKGRGTLNGIEVGAGTLVRANGLRFSASAQSQLIVFYHDQH